MDPVNDRPAGWVSEADPTFVSTGQLPAPEQAQALVDEAFARSQADASGAVSDVYPALASVDPDLFGICTVGRQGRVFAAGDADVEFTIMSVAKPFVFAMVCQDIGPEAMRERIGVNATGRPFNSLAAIEASPDGRTNPMVNPGAIATTSLIRGTTVEDRWGEILETLSRFAGRSLSLNAEVYESASQTNMRNRGIAQLLAGLHRLGSEPMEALDLYTRQSSLNVTARDLATMGATLAFGGTNPLTGVAVVDPHVCRFTLAVMATAGLYETSGEWLYDVGLPGKSGIGGGIVTVSPGKGGLGTFAPRLDPAGNSVRGQQVARFLSRSLGMDLFASAPVAS